MENRWQVMIV
uniref:Vif protein n=3 Tax=Human immunodeficiency virus type 1 TaxID=11676 RepID=K0GM23_HV1